MARFPSFDGVQLAYEEEGEGPATVLLHGFASNGYINWVRPRVVDALVAAGRRAVIPDLRGHGASEKPHRPEAYAGDALARDAQALLDHLGLEAVDVVGFSLGARVAMRLLGREPRLRSCVLAGVGAHSLDEQRGDPEVMALALLAQDKTAIADPTARSFRDFADVTKADREALAALWRAGRPAALDGTSDVRVPVLVLAAEGDPIAGPPEPLASLIPGARVAVVAGTHLNVVNNPAFHRALVDFLVSV